MSLRSATRTRLEFLRQYPIDLGVVTIAAIGAYLVVTTYESGHAVRLLATFPLVLFFPGYALASFLFPAAARPARQNAPREAERRPGGIDTVERLGLGFALSLALVPMIVIGLALTAWGLRADPAAAAFATVTVGFAQLGVVRRLFVPEPERYTVSPLAGIERFRRRWDEDTLEAASSVVLAVAIAVAGIVMAAAFVSPNSATGFTELGLYTEDEDGELVAGELPSAVESGESIPFTVVVESNEGERMNYSVVIQEQVIEDDTVVERTTIDEFDAWSDDGGTVVADREVTPTVAEGTVRIVVLLYEEDRPVNPTRENAAEDVYFWVTVEAEQAELADAGADGDDIDGITPVEIDDDGDSEDIDETDDDGEAGDDAETDDDGGVLGDIIDSLFGDDDD